MIDLEKNKKTIIELIIFTVVIIFAFVNIEALWSFITYIIKIFMPFIIGVMIAFVLNVLLNVVENKLFKKLNEKNGKVWKKIKRPTSLITTFIIIIALIAFILGLLIPQLKNTATIFTENFDSYKKESIKILDKIGIDDKDIKVLNKNIEKIKGEVTSYVGDNKQEIVQTTFGVASSVVGTITSLVLGIVFAIYILLKKEDLARQSRKVLKAYLPEKKEKRIREIANLSNKTFGNFISGQCLEALIIGVLCFIGMFILQIPYASTISVLVGFTALIPVFGAFIGTVIGAFLILMVDPTKAIIFIIFILILQQLEGNLIYPKVVGKSVGLPGIWVMVAVTVGASIAGVLGMLLSVPICSVLYSILKTDVNNRIDQKNKQPLTIKHKEKKRSETV
ncbi:MAG: AI-2E family transporter [Bacilli bacterium]|nr:AI-2E family transporter [Bacilli bacterium]